MYNHEFARLYLVEIKLYYLDCFLFSFDRIQTRQDRP